jgi:hypothetical protein
MSFAHADMGNKLIDVATAEVHPPLAAATRKMGRSWHTYADLDAAQEISDRVILGDSLGYQGLNARSAKVYRSYPLYFNTEKKSRKLYFKGVLC